MKFMSPTDIVVDILKKHAEWMESSLLLGEVMKERDVSDRQAYRDILAACEEGRVRKVELPDDRVYGLSNWPFPTITSKKQSETLTFQDAFLYRCFKKLDEIGKLSDEGNPGLALKRLNRFVNMLPTQPKEKLVPSVRQAYVKLAKTKNVDFFTTQVAKLRCARGLVEDLIDEISTVLHES